MRTAVTNAPHLTLAKNPRWISARWTALIGTFLLLLAIVPASRAADPPTLLAHGSADTYWYAVVKSDGAESFERATANGWIVV